ncbi:MFS transporter [Aurantivibrio plasticivorans]
MASRNRTSFIETLYGYVTGDEDSRVCKDIPDGACNDQPRNFFSYLAANLLGKVADEISSAKLTIPWLFGLLGVPAIFTGFLVPIREGGVLLPQLVVAAVIRRVSIRKTVWLVGSALSALSLFGMAYVVLNFDGAEAGSAIIAMLVLFSLSRGICSVSAKDVLGKTISKSRRGALMGWSASLSGVAILAIGLLLSKVDFSEYGVRVFAGLLATGGVLWILASVIFASIQEQPGATEGGGNAFSVAVEHFQTIKTDKNFRSFVIARGLLLSVGLAPPFYALIAQAHLDSSLLGLSALLIANGIAGSLSAPVWGYMGDQSSKRVMMLAATGAGLLGIFTFFAVSNDISWAISEIGLAAMFLVLNVMHGGVRLGRKVYLVDMATADNRAAYVALSNTIIGLLMLLGGLTGLISDLLGSHVTVGLLGVVSLTAVFYIKFLPNVSEPT